MPKMKGTGQDPLGRYSDGLIFDLEDNDPDMVQDFVDKGWAELLPEEEHPGRTKTQIAAAVVRGDQLADPVEQQMADEIGDDAHAIVHLEDPDATASQYEEEAQKGPAKNQKEMKRQIPSDFAGGGFAEAQRGPGGGTRGSRASQREVTQGSTASGEGGASKS